MKRLVALVLILTLAGGATAQEIHGGAADWGESNATTETLVEIPEGAALRVSPATDAELVAVLPSGRVPLLETVDSWIRIEIGDLHGWVDLAAEVGRAAVSIAAVRERVTKAQLPPLDIPSHGLIGRYRFFAEDDQAELETRLATVAMAHAEVYAMRYRLDLTKNEPDGDKPDGGAPIGDVAVFSSTDSYHHYLARHDRPGLPSGGHHHAFFRSPDRVVIIRNSRSIRQVTASLVHELTHLLNWRVFVLTGAREVGLPIWLDEGLAEDLTLASFSKRGHLRAGRLTEDNLRYGRRLGLMLDEVDRERRFERAPSLTDLVAMNRSVFLADRFNTLIAALWIRFFLDDSHGQPEQFRHWLGSLTSSPDGQDLLTSLDIPNDELTSRFEDWLVRHRNRFFE